MVTTVLKSSQVTETGHVKNLSNFKAVIAAATSFGNSYNPSKPGLTIAEMQKLAEKGDLAISNVSAAMAVYKKAIDSRNSAFEPLNKLLTRVMNALKASDTTDNMDKSARELVRKIQGVRSKPKRTEEEKKADTEAGIIYDEVSASQMSYDSRTGNFRELVQLLSSIPEYIPNEKELQVDTLKSLSDDLITKNIFVINAMMALNNARASRNEIMYSPVKGMVDVALDVKSYLKSVFGPTSLQYKKVAGLDFTKYKN
ncbi:MAG TPA: hypothetical protein VHO46_00250 [Bacteroidales bacterium]|nr:hypothetical protein [Bacteroidales bacterium]